MTLSGNDTNSTGAWQGVIRRYAEYLPVDDSTPVVSLLEGNTPLIRADRLAREIGGDIELHLKYEGLNPTASFKDRGMTMAVSKAMERGAEVVVCASTGNTSASAAAYAARAGIKCVVLLPHGKIALGKLAQALMHGATTIAIEGNFDDALRIVRELGETGQVEVVNSINPVRIEGQKTAAFEVVDQLGQAPDFHFLPVGNAGNITAYWKGYNEYSRRRLGQGGAEDVRFSGRQRSAAGRGSADQESANGGHGHPHRQPGQLGRRDERPQGIQRPHCQGDR